MKISVVTTLYYSAPYIQEFYERVTAAVQKITPDYEIIFVNDGSPDDALNVAINVHQQDSHVLVVDLSRNFGHHKAIMTGLNYSSGDLVYLLDCDLEEPPEVLLEFYQKLTDANADMVYGVQEVRERGLVDRLGGDAYYMLFNFLSEVPIPRNLLTVRLMTRRYVDQLINYRERVFVLSGLWALTGFKQIALPVNKLYKGQTSYNFARKLASMLDSITVFSNKPLIYIAYFGLILTLLAIVAIAVLVFRYYTGGIGTDGWTSVIMSIWLFSGIIILTLGIISLYISVIFTEVKARPYTVVRQFYAHPEQEKVGQG